MNAECIYRLLTVLIYLSVFLLILGGMSAAAEKLFPRIPFIARYLDSLPDIEEDGEHSEKK